MNDVKFAECKFSGDMVPYMYGELSATKGSAFESHLLDCSECTDEFASLSHARYEVYDWKKLEFDNLATPQFEIPYEVTAVETASSWVKTLRAAFAHRWSVPGFAFAGLAIVTIYAAIALSPGDNAKDIATRTDNSNIASVEGSSLTTPSRTTTVSETDSPTETRREIERAPIHIAAPIRAEQNRIVSRTKSAQSRRSEAKQASTRKEQTNVPTFNDFAEDEDTSLRLAELFDDIETSE